MNILYQIRLSEKHQPTGKTRHFRSGQELPRPIELRIAQYDGDPGYYLFYCDSLGGEMTDTYHDSIEEAFAQAEWEFAISKDEWTMICKSDLRKE